MSGTKKVRLKNIADEAGISISAVSMALADSPQISDETKRKVRDIAQRLGYVGRRASRRNRGGRSKDRKRFGFLGVGKRLEDETLSAMLHGLAGQGTNQRVRIEIAAFSDADAELPAIEDYIQDLDGVLLYGMVTPQLAAIVDRHELPAVALGPVLDAARHGGSVNVRCVLGDMVAMGRLGTSWLLARGHTRVAFLVGSMPRGMYNACWYDGYCLAQMDSDHELDRDLILSFDNAARHEQVDAAIQRLRDLPEPPTAFVIPDMYVARGFFDAIQNLGWDVDPGTVVLGSRPNMGPRSPAVECPIITEDADLITAAAVELLLHHDLSETLKKVDVIVPFVTERLG